MAIREDLVASAVKFLVDPSVASSSLSNRIAFLKSKNLTQEEIDAALQQAGAQESTPAQATQVASQSAAYSQPVTQYQQYPPPGWQQQPPPPVPKRDWRDWFIMATVMGGVSYGLYFLTKRYVSPLIAPPTPERLEQDKKSIDDKFDKAFALIDQLATDTTELKNAEQARTERLDKALADLETVLNDLKSANRRREDDAQRVRDDVQGLKDAIPRAMNAQKDLTDGRLRDLNSELKSLKTLLSQRMPTSTSTPTPALTPGLGNYLRQTNGNVSPAPTPAAAATTPAQPIVTDENKEPTSTTATPAEEVPAPPKPYTDYVSSLGKGSPFSSGIPAAKASIPAWQMASATKSTSKAAGEGSGSASQEASGSA